MINQPYYTSLNYPQYGTAPSPQKTLSQTNMTLPWQWIQGGEDTARNWYMNPGSIIALWDADEQIIYLKSTDTTGKPTIKKLRYTIDEDQVSDGNYATRADIDKLTKELEELRAKLEPKKEEKK